MRNLVNENIQDFTEKPVLFGSDVVGLYPNLDGTCVANIAAKCIMKTKVMFDAIDYTFLIMYLMLIIGRVQLIKLGLGQCLPTKRTKDKSNSLLLASNRNKENWDFTRVQMNQTQKKKMLATLIQIMIILMMKTTCYRFGGRIYRQRNGLGIGLRGSAALARLVMCEWDYVWGTIQAQYNIKIQILFRYVDDLRTYMWPIAKGWYWENKQWIFLPDREDDRTPLQRTVQEIGKSLCDVWDFIKFTTETEEEFHDNHLPTLDFATKVLDSGYISYRFFTKPMASNLTLQQGTALSKGTVFSSLRQDLVRRLLNTDYQLGAKARIEVIKEYIQRLVNSSHQFVYIKSIVLQALSKYTYMVERSQKSPADKCYAPLHRSRHYQMDVRKLRKYTNYSTWYTGEDLGDEHRNN